MIAELKMSSAINASYCGLFYIQALNLMLHCPNLNSLLLNSSYHSSTNLANKNILTKVLMELNIDYFDL